MNPIELLERMVAIDSPSRGEAELAAFLVSDRNSYMSGEVIVQDGGVVV